LTAILSEDVRIVAVHPVGDSAMEVTYKDADGQVGQQLSITLTKRSCAWRPPPARPSTVTVPPGLAFYAISSVVAGWDRRWMTYT
jgi:hypothetical protein